MTKVLNLVNNRLYLLNKKQDICSKLLFSD